MGAKTRETLVDWLVSEMGVPFDVWFPTSPPPVTPRELAAAWYRHDPSETEDDWLAAIDMETDQIASEDEWLDAPRSPLSAEQYAHALAVRDELERTGEQHGS